MFASLVSLLVVGLSQATLKAEEPVAVYSSGQDGYHTYRIPSLCTTVKGTLLAFCEGRKNGAGDSGDIDLLLKRSEDGGKTWSRHQVIWDDGENTCGNPCAVIDRQSGAISLLMTWNRGSDTEQDINHDTSLNTRRVYLTRSVDDGKTWTPALEITATTKLPEWSWYATGPGSGIQIQNGPYKGRLIIPCDHVETASKKRYSHAILSDDGGKTWRLGGTTPKDQVNECEAVELPGHQVMLNMRNYDPSTKARQVALSDDGGITWHSQRIDPALIEPICQASIERMPSGGLLFLNPASASRRVKMTLRLSSDHGKTWPGSLLLNEGMSAYSDMAILRDGTVGCLYEAGNSRSYEMIVFQRVTVK